MATGDMSEAALASAVTHLLGQSRAFLHQVEAALSEVAGLHDERVTPLVEALRLTSVEPAQPGSLRHLERVASELARSLNQVGQS
jgi:hypothetical protein